MAQLLKQTINYSQEELIVCDQSFIAHPSGALIWPGTKTLVLADLYLRSGFCLSALRQLGDKSQASEQLNTIKTLINTNTINQVIAIGRSFRRLDDPYHMEDSDLNTLYNIQKQVDWLWVAGPAARNYPSQVGGIRMVKYEQEGLIFRAQPRKEPVTHEIAAGMYPMARLTEPKETIFDEPGLPAFVSNRKRLLMPAFGGKLAARNILGDDFLPFFGYDDLMVQVVDKFKTYPVPPSLLKAG